MNVYCLDCNKKMRAGRMCAGCKQERLRLRDQHREGGTNEPRAFVNAKEPRIKLYTAIIESGGRIFE